MPTSMASTRGICPVEGVEVERCPIRTTLSIRSSLGYGNESSMPRKSEHKDGTSA
jgi:hypothetical protein